MDRTAPVPYHHFDTQSQHLAPPSSLGRSRSRREVFTDNEIAPLLSNLSPSATLEALTATDAISIGEKNHQTFIQNSVASASTSERAWGIKAALAGKKLREWHQELSGWSWPTFSGTGRSGFQVPSPERGSGDNGKEEYWGSLPAKIIQGYEERVEAIKDDMETLEVEDLKNYVRNTHLKSGTRRSSQGLSKVASGMDYEHLDDFTAIITATIVQALPTLSRLNSLLNDWSIRLLILCQVPDYLRDREGSKEFMLSAWRAVDKLDSLTAKRKSDFSRQAFLDIQAVLQDQISHLGRRLDSMLDVLAGSKDTLPDEWCVELDNLENEYSAWVVEAEELVFNNEMDVENNETQAKQSQNYTGLDVGLPLDIGRPTHALDVHAQFEDVKQRADTEFDPDIERSSKDGRPHSHENKFAAGEPTRTAVDHDTLSLELSDSGPQRHDVIRPFVGGLARKNFSNECSPESRPSSHDQTLAMTDQPLKDSVLDGPTEVSNSGRNAKEEAHTTSREPISSHKIPQRLANRPSPLVFDRSSLFESTASSDLGSEISSPGSATSDYFSNKSSPEIRDASVVEYIASPVLKSPIWPSKDPITPLDIVSRHSSQRTERGDSRFPQMGSWSGFGTPVSQRSRASTYIPETSADEIQEPAEGEHLHPPGNKGHVRTRSASMQSFEVVPKSEIRKIVVRRSESYSSPPGTSRLVPGLNSISAEETPFQGPDKRTDEPDKHDSDSSEPLSLPKPRHRFEQVLDLGLGSTPVKVNEKKSVETSDNIHIGSSTPLSGHKTSKSADDQLEARISSILTSIPAHIRLTSGPEPDAPEITRFSPFPGPKAPASRPPALRLNRAQTSSPTMTLAPAQPKTSKSKSQNGEPEIKLYHLHQAGKDVPIKLFVRLVGEAGERVMVRIGGGWADLAEYLKEYATHHGRRAVSDGRFDIQGLPSSPLASQVSPTSRPVTPSSTGPSIMRKQQNTPGQFETPHTPASDPSLRPASWMSWTEEDSPSLGLAGPKTKKVDISPRKQAWVDEMLDQARQGGAEKFGDIGKVGGTKRVFLKSKAENQ